MTERRLLSVREVRDQFNQSHVGVYRRINAGDFEAIKVGKRTFLTRESIERYFANCPRIAPKAAS